MERTNKTKRLTTSAIMLALATVLAIVCALIPFLNLPFGGGFTVASMLPVIVISYMYGLKWGFFTSFTYSVIQIVLDLLLGKGGSVIMAAFMPSSEDYMGLVNAIFMVIIDYFLAYTVLGIGGIFGKRIKDKTVALTLGAGIALTFRYVCHIISGYIFFGAYAEWFFSQEGFYKIGGVILDTFSGKVLALIYSVFYNGLYMIPEIVITCIAASVISVIPQIKREVSLK